MLDQKERPLLARLKGAAADHSAEIVHVVRVLFLPEMRRDYDEPMPAGKGDTYVAGKLAGPRVAVQMKTIRACGPASTGRAYQTWMGRSLRPPSSRNSKSPNSTS